MKFNRKKETWKFSDEKQNWKQDVTIQKKGRRSRKKWRGKKTAERKKLRDAEEVETKHGWRRGAKSKLHAWKQDKNEFLFDVVLLLVTRFAMLRLIEPKIVIAALVVHLHLSLSLTRSLVCSFDVRLVFCALRIKLFANSFIFFLLFASPHSRYCRFCFLVSLLAVVKVASFH